MVEKVIYGCGKVSQCIPALLQEAGTLAQYGDCDVCGDRVVGSAVQFGKFTREMLEINPLAKIVFVCMGCLATAVSQKPVNANLVVGALPPDPEIMRMKAQHDARQN